MNLINEVHLNFFINFLNRRSSSEAIIKIRIIHDIGESEYIHRSISIQNIKTYNTLKRLSNTLNNDRLNNYNNELTDALYGFY